MEIVDKRNLTATKEFGELPIGAVFEIPVTNEKADWFGICMKINSAVSKDNTIDLEDCCTATVMPHEKVYELNAHLVIEGR